MDVSELDVVTLTTPLVSKGLEAGAVGTVVHVFHSPNTAYEVEFVDDDGTTTAMATLTRDQFRPCSSPPPDVRKPDPRSPVMTDVEPQAWLTQEANDLLDQGTVGLYEFIWSLRGTSFNLPDDEAIQLARRIAGELVRSGKALIFAVTWPGLDIVEGPLPVTTLEDPKSWSEGESGPLIALVPTDDVP